MSTVIAMYCVTYKVRIIFTEWSFIFYDSKQTSTPLHLWGFYYEVKYLRVRRAPPSIFVRAQPFVGMPEGTKSLRKQVFRFLQAERLVFLCSN